MTDQPDPEYRSFTDPPGDAIEYRQPEDDDGTFDVRMPIATTGEVRNEGDEPLTRDELGGMARQIEDRTVGVFIDHGGSLLGGRERYSAVEKLGEWVDPEVQQREADDTDELVATARLMDPETLPNGVASIREAVGAIKEQVKRGFSVSASIGWRDDDAYPGGVDLMEASIVGIGADPRTTSEASTAVVARAAVDAGADPDELLASVREAVADDDATVERENPDDARPFGPPNGPGDLWDDFEECVTDVEGWEGVDDPEAFCAWAENQSESDADAPDDESDAGDTTDHDMSDNDNPPDDGDTTDDVQESDEPDETQETMSAEEFREEMLAMQRDQLALLETLAEDGDDMEDDDDEEENEMGEDEEEDDEEDEQSADEPDEEQSVEERIAAMEEELEQFRSGEIDADTPDDDEPEEQRDATDGPDNQSKYGVNL